jgi:hypothetical protein
MASVVTATAVARASHRDARDGDDDDDDDAHGANMSLNNAALLASLISFPLSLFLASRIDEGELLLAAGALLVMALAVAPKIARRIYKSDDGRIDAFEGYGLRVLTFLYTLVYLVTVQFGIILFNTATTAWPLPPLSEVVLVVAMVIVIAVAIVPTFAAPLVPVTRKGGDTKKRR